MKACVISMYLRIDELGSSVHMTNIRRPQWPCSLHNIGYAQEQNRYLL